MLQEINRQGLSNADWSIEMFLEPVNTKSQYGTDEEFMLPAGIWLVVYAGYSGGGDVYNQLKPDFCKSVCITDEAFFFNMSD